MSWTDERVELLKKMWGEGQSASQIAKELGGVTRNAVIGKVHRLGLSNRAGAPEAKPTATPATASPQKSATPTPHGRPLSSNPPRRTQTSNWPNCWRKRSRFWRWRGSTVVSSRSATSSISTP